MTVWSVAPNVATIARARIDSVHRHLSDVAIRYLWRDVHQTSKGRAVWAKTRLVSGLNVYLAAEDEVPEGDEAEPFFVIEVAADVWAVLDADQRTALIDHELCHCHVDLEGKMTVAPHDLEEFVGVVERHGLWRAEVEALVKAGADQLQLAVT